MRTIYITSNTKSNIKTYIDVIKVYVQPCSDESIQGSVQNLKRNGSKSYRCVCLLLQKPNFFRSQSKNVNEKKGLGNRNQLVREHFSTLANCLPLPVTTGSQTTQKEYSIMRRHNLSCLIQPGMLVCQFITQRARYRVQIWVFRVQI